MQDFLRVTQEERISVPHLLENFNSVRFPESHSRGTNFLPTFTSNSQLHNISWKSLLKKQRDCRFLCIQATCLVLRHVGAATRVSVTQKDTCTPSSSSHYCAPDKPATRSTTLRANIRICYSKGKITGLWLQYNVYWNSSLCCIVWNTLLDTWAKFD